MYRGLILIMMCSALLGEQIDVVQVDTGNPINYNDILKMPANNAIFHEHGKLMAFGLHDQLLLLKEKAVVYGIQIPWDLHATSIIRLLLALKDAVELSSKIISLSLSGKEPNIQERYLLESAGKDHNTLVVVAAGNNYNENRAYPASYSLPCLISVGTLKDGKRASYSNDGTVWLEYNSKDVIGTSSSTARMAAIALHVWRATPEAKCYQVKQSLIKLYGR